MPPTPAGFAAGITRVLHDPGLAARLAANARRYAEERLAWPLFVREIATIYASTWAAARP